MKERQTVHPILPWGHSLQRIGDIMKLKHHALAIASMAALGFTGSAQAVQVAGELLEIYGNIYPQYQSVSFSSSSATGTALSNLTAGRSGSPTQTLAAAAADAKKLNSVNSYIGFKGQRKIGDLTAGYDVQGVLNIDSSNGSSFLSEPRDAFVFIGHKTFGTLSVGQQDTVYKMNGDKVRMLGVSSSNFVSTSNVASQPSWRAASVSGADTAGGTTSFNTRINSQFVWVSPRMAGFEVGVSMRPDPNKTATRNQSLSALAVNWENKDGLYLGLANETHNDYRTFSGTRAAATSGRIWNTSTDANPLRSKDTATRLSLGYKGKGYRIGADTSNIKYSETPTTAEGFKSHTLRTWQVTGEYQVTGKLTLAAEYANNGAGKCETASGACSTTGLGGTLFGLGAKYNLDRNFAVFAIAARGNANDAGVINLGSGAGRTAVGGDINAMAIGIQARF
jgi:predicted porin